MQSVRKTRSLFSVCLKLVGMYLGVGLRFGIPIDNIDSEKNGTHTLLVEHKLPIVDHNEV